MSECDRIEEYLDDDMSAAERAAMDRHVEACPGCSRAVRDYRRLRRLALEAPAVEVPDDLGYRIRRRLAAAGPRRRPARILRPFAFAGAAAAAAVLLVVLLRPGAGPDPLPPELPVAVRSDATPGDDLGTAVADWLVQAGNADGDAVGRLRAEARELDLLPRVRAALPAARGTEEGEYLTAVSDLLVQLENGPGSGFLAEEARLVARGRPQ